MASMKDLRERANALPEPHRTNARMNIRDAIDDLMNWPGYAHEIVEDCAHAIEAHETAARGSGESAGEC